MPSPQPVRPYLVLYARFDVSVYLLSIKHHKQFSFDFLATGLVR
jgi:hypothetical protein